MLFLLPDDFKQNMYETNGMWKIIQIKTILIKT